jgi:hypothetical protein
VATKIPTITITFPDPNAPQFKFENWVGSCISLGSVERASMLMLREAMRQQAIAIQAQRALDEPRVSDSTDEVENV